MKHLQAPRRAFTLIEILVVIVIIALLAGLIFPVFSRVREEGRKTSCLSNMKQLGLAFEQYTADSRGKYPLAGNFQAWAPGYAHWTSGTAGTNTSMVSISPLPSTPGGAIADPTFQNAANVQAGALFPYVKSTAVYVCPSSKFGEETGLSYGMNCALSGLSAVKVRAPGDTVLLVDEKYPTDGFFYARNICDGNGCSTDTLQTKHNGGGNLLFADGHVKFFTTDQFTIDNSDKGLENKARLTGSPRFHDRAFGSSNGSSLVGFQDPVGTSSPTLDSCAVELTAPAPTSAPPAPIS